MKIKALSVLAPWGRKIAEGRKTVEVRSWMPHGLTAGEDLLIIENNRPLIQDGDEDPLGRATAMVKILRVRPFLTSDLEASGASRFEPGWYAWELGDVRVVDLNRPFRAASRIYEVEVPEWEE